MQHKRIRLRALLVAIPAAALVSACSSTIPQVDNVHTGSVLVLVTDQNGTAVGNANVELDNAASGGSAINNVYTATSVNSLGKAEFDQVGIGSHAVWVAPPAGYTGGGTSNGQSVTVVEGQTTNVTLKLTKTSTS